ncbi:hypothetical protein [Pseudohaliea sp.]|uniref:hypothetical protein n=1 Tax=Pseudohaliea sp. TaxID=2740289 RepID=UPI0032F00721
MKLKTGDFVFQTEFQTDSQCNRWQRVWRRRVLRVTDDRIALAGAEVLTLPLDFPGDLDWLPCEGMLAMDTTLSWEKFTERGYSTSFRLGRGAA